MGTWVLVILMLNSSGEWVTAGQGKNKLLSQIQCDQIGAADVENKAATGEYADVTYVCLSKDRKAPVRKPAKKST